MVQERDTAMYRLPLKAKFAARALVGVFAVAGLLAAAPSCAQGDLLVAPTRVIIDNRGTAEVVIGKQRHGPIGTVKLSFNEDLTKFGNLAREGRFDGY